MTLQTFAEFELISGLALNAPKAVIVPLYLTDYIGMAVDIGATYPLLSGVRVEGKAKYLGFFLGPLRADASFDKPFVKYLDRARAWGATHGRTWCEQRIAMFHAKLQHFGGGIHS